MPVDVYFKVRRNYITQEILEEQFKWTRPTWWIKNHLFLNSCWDVNLVYVYHKSRNVSFRGTVGSFLLWENPMMKAESVLNLYIMYFCSCGRYVGFDSLIMKQTETDLKACVYEL